MTVETTTARVTYTGAGTTGPFSVPFYFLEDDDLTVIKTAIADGTEETLVLTTDYTVSGAADEAGGSVTLTASLSSAYRLTIIRDPDLLQSSDYPPNDKFPATTHERVVDKLTMIAQRLKDLINRSFRLSDGDVSGISLSLSNLSASKLIAVNSAGTALEAVSAADVGLTPVSAFAATLLDDADAAAARTTLGAAGLGANFRKADPSTVAFTKTGAGTAQIKAGTKIDVAGTLVEFASATSITMPTLTAGTDYAIWVKDDATIQADASFTSAPGAGNWRQIGGFHYAPGGNAAGTSGGDTTPAINAYSFWDLKFRPACPDPRGMTLVADSFWADIYLLGVDHLTNGTSKYNVSIADDSAPPKIPTKFGGNGSTAYSTLNWWEAAEVMQSWGKRLPTYDEFAALAYGTTEAQASGGTDVPTTGVTGTGATNAWNKFTSRWGVIQSTGCMWIWGGEFGGGAADASWTANTGGRGSTYQMENAVLLGGNWGNTSNVGSRCSAWNTSPASPSNSIGARGVCDHLVLD